MRKNNKHYMRKRKSTQKKNAVSRKRKSTQRRVVKRKSVLKQQKRTIKRGGGGPTEDLFEAVRTNNIELANRALEEGADVNSKDKYNYSVLFNAVFEHQNDMVEFLLKKGANVDIIDSYGNTPLFYVRKENNSSYEGRFEIAKLLIDHGADVNHKNEDGSTPLFYMASYGDFDMVGLLIAHGANVNHLDNEGNNVVFGAISKNGELEYYGDEYARTMEILLYNGLDINSEGKNGESLLHVSVMFLQPWIIELLLSSGVNVNSKDKNGKTALTLILPKILKVYEDEYEDEYEEENKYKKIVDVIKELLKEGADVNSKDEDGRTLLILLAIAMQNYNSNSKVFKILFDTMRLILKRYNIDVNVADAFNQTAADYCIDIPKCLRILGVNEERLLEERRLREADQRKRAREQSELNEKLQIERSRKQAEEQQRRRELMETQDMEYEESLKQDNLKKQRKNVIKEECNNNMQVDEYGTPFVEDFYGTQIKESDLYSLDGFCYDLTQLYEWIEKKGSRRHPSTNAPLNNEQISAIINEYKRRYQQEIKTD